MPTLPPLRIFVATRPEDVPCRHFVSVDGSVPGAALTWDHHRSGEAINLDAMPERADLSAFDGIGTTMADTDAVASVVAALAGGKGALAPEVRRVLEAASHRCDHLAAHPGVDPETDHLGRGLHAWVSHALEQGRPFEAVCLEVAATRPLPWRDPVEDTPALAGLVALGRLDPCPPVALADLRGLPPLPPESLYALHRCPVMVLVDDHPAGGARYVVGVHPGVDHPEDLRPALVALAAAEFAHGAPALSAEPVPGAETWGGRQTVFGSPWNYGSRLAPEEVRALVAGALGLRD
ncbi:MAG: hypothetical protein ABIO70_17000 [Pseudomonadota bacterium]